MPPSRHGETERAGLPLAEIGTTYINTQFVYRGDGDFRGLLMYQDVSTAVRACQPEVIEWTDAANAPPWPATGRLTHRRASNAASLTSANSTRTATNRPQKPNRSSCYPHAMQGISPQNCAPKAMAICAKCRQSSQKPVLMRMHAVIQPRYR